MGREREKNMKRNARLDRKKRGKEGRRRGNKETNNGRTKRRKRKQNNEWHYQSHSTG